MSTYEIITRPVRNSRQVYTTIRCLTCREVSHSLDDLEKKYCPFCKKFHDQEEKKPVAAYKLYRSSGKKATKVHWSVNGKNSLCMVAVRAPAGKDVPESQICVNCDSLKARNVVR